MFRCRSTQSGAVRSEPYAHKNCYLDLYGYNVKTKQPPTKPLIWMGSSKKDLRALPADVVDVFGYALYVAQTGKRHDNTKVLKGFGGGSVLEIIESHAGNAYPRRLHRAICRGGGRVACVSEKVEVRNRDPETRYGSDRRSVEEGH